LPTFHDLLLFLPFGAPFVLNILVLLCCFLTFWSSFVVVAASFAFFARFVALFHFSLIISLNLFISNRSYSVFGPYVCRVQQHFATFSSRYILLFLWRRQLLCHHNIRAGVGSSENFYKDHPVPWNQAVQVQPQV
jgi:hypothetical protein